MELNFLAKKGEKAKLLDMFITVFWRQNTWHKHGVLMHTIGVTLSVLKDKDYKMLSAALLHDVGKPSCAIRDEDKDTLSYSFHFHEEKSYQMIKNIGFISDYTKNLVRWHYLLRGKHKSLQKYHKTGDNFHLQEHERQKNIWENLDENFQNDLKKFLIHDDTGKNISNLFKKDFQKNHRL